MLDGVETGTGRVHPARKPPPHALVGTVIVDLHKGRGLWGFAGRGGITIARGDGEDFFPGERIVTVVEPFSAVVAAQARRQFVERAFDGAAQGGSRGFGGGRFDYADRADRRRRQGFAAAIQDQGGDGAAVESDPATVLQRRAVDRQQTLSVAGESADRRLVDDAGAARRKPDHVAVLDDERLLDLALAREFGMRDQVAGFAMHRDGNLRADHLVHAHQLVAGRMPRDMDEMVLLGDDLDTKPNQRVLQPVDRLLVAWNDARREDDDIPRFERDVRVIVAGDP